MSNFRSRRCKRELKHPCPSCTGIEVAPPFTYAKGEPSGMVGTPGVHVQLPVFMMVSLNCSMSALGMAVVAVPDPTIVAAPLLVESGTELRCATRQYSDLHVSRRSGRRVEGYCEGHCATGGFNRRSRRSNSEIPRIATSRN